ncbi:MAG: hypothetical protein WA851_22110 [Xanthobacteraceae bacterium]
MTERVGRAPEAMTHWELVEEVKRLRGLLAFGTDTCAYRAMRDKNERLHKIEAAAKALKFSAYPAHGSGFVLIVSGGNISGLEAALLQGDLR